MARTEHDSNTGRVAHEPVPVRLRRHLILSGLVADSVSMARAASEDARDDARARLISRLTRLHGLPQKIAQLMTTDDLLSSSTVPHADEPPRPVLATEQVKALLRQDAPHASFEWIDPGIPASLGQVHRARLKDGREVAVKVQYPGIREAIESDLKSLGWLMRPLGGLKRGFSMGDYRAELGDMLTEELDYRREAEMLRRYSKRLAGLDGLCCPKPIDGFCSERIITMSWIDGDAFDSCRYWTRDERALAAKALLGFFLRGVLEWNELFADAHPGNVLFRRDSSGPVVGIVDFGCVRSVPTGMADALKALIAAAYDKRLAAMPVVELVHWYERAGFNRALLEPMAAKLPPLTALILEPFASSKPFSIDHWRLSERAERILGNDRWNFRVAGPPSLLGFIRAYFGIVKHLQALAPALDWRAALDGIPFDRPSPVAGANAAGEAPILSAPTDLRIRVQKQGRIRADLTFKGHLAAELPDLIPPEVAPELARRGIDVQQLAARAVENRFSPTTLFEFTDEEKSVRVWLEKKQSRW